MAGKRTSGAKATDQDLEDRNAWTPTQTTSWGQQLERKCQERIWAYDDTGNPIYVWAALSAWSFGQHASSAKEGPAGFEMPRRLALLVMMMSNDILSLASGISPKQHQDGELVQRDPDQPDLTPAEKLSLVPAALRLSQGKWNAFAAFDAERLAEYLADVRAAARESGKSYEEANEAVMEALGTTDERTARRRLAGGRRAEANKAPWLRNRPGAK